MTTTTSDPDAPVRWRIDLEYDGAGFVGWQIQPRGESIQGCVERAVEQLFGEHCRVSASGRTDAGVHAARQVASFVTRIARSERAVRDGLNSKLPRGIAVLSATRVPLAFDPRRDVIRKRYRYTWLCRASRSPLYGHRVWHVREPLDEASMHTAVRSLLGTHDFSSFRAAGCQAAHPVRTLEDAGVTRTGAEVHFDVVGNGFLRHMVRILAGTLWDVGRGRISSEGFDHILQARDRAAAGRTAPPQGLMLMDVTYPGDQ